jgi:hypothetical protein
MIWTGIIRQWILLNNKHKARVPAANDFRMDIQRKLYLLIAIAVCGCSQYAPIEHASILGEYFSIAGAKHYSHLELREDFTYHFDQSQNWSCDGWLHYYGHWEISSDKLILYRGITLDSLLLVQREESVTADTLHIHLSDKLLQTLPALKVRLTGDTADLPIVNNAILINKLNYISNDTTKGQARDKQSDYRYTACRLELRSGSYHGFVQYILDSRRIDVSIDQVPHLPRRPAILLEYRHKDSLLISTTSHEWIRKHRLQKATTKP